MDIVAPNWSSDDVYDGKDSHNGKDGHNGKDLVIIFKVAMAMDNGHGGPHRIIL